jgi:hypothetical protein
MTDMKIGELYKIAWPEPMVVHMRIGPPMRSFWDRAGAILYLGTETYQRGDGERITSHAVLANGQKRLLNSTFLQFLEPLTFS